MANNNKKGNAFTNNPIVKAIGTQRLIALLALIVVFTFFCLLSPAFRQYSTFVSIFDDFDIYREYKASCFLSLKEYRKQKINNLISIL